MDWKNHGDRIKRWQEKENFRAVIMPLSFLGAVLGWVALLWEGWVAMEGGRVEGAVWVPATFFAVLPGALLLVRWARGHFSRRLMA